MRYCIITDCSKHAPYKSGYCPMHYQRDKAHGDPTIVIPRGTRHGLKNHPLYAVWRGVKARCFNQNVKAYHNYGGRGITIDKEFLNPAIFIDYLSELPGYDQRGIGSNGLTLDRIDNDGNYVRGNLRWATRKVQRNNQRSL